MKSIARIIDEDMKLLTTSQKLHKLRKDYSDRDIIYSLSFCSRGNREAMMTLLDKSVVAKYESEDREVSESEKDYYE